MNRDLKDNEINNLIKEIKNCINRSSDSVLNNNLRATIVVWYDYYITKKHEK